MRPPVLDSFFKSVSSLQGCGPKLTKLLLNLGIETYLDLLFHLPTGFIDRSGETIVPGQISTFEANVLKHYPPGRKGLPYRIDVVAQGDKYISLIFFHAKGDYLSTLLPEGEKRFISGKVDLYNNMLQITHPDHVQKTRLDIPAFEAVYPLTAGVTSRTLSKLIGQVLAEIPELPEWQPEAKISFRQALVKAHHPQKSGDIDKKTSLAVLRLAYDELLANQLALLLVREKHRKESGTPIIGDGHLCRATLKALPFALTSAQKKALKEIFSDMRSPFRMLRLLQGDVGSGKTVVALFAMLNAAETGAQSALMAPTDILARQHFETISKLSTIPVYLLTGKDKGKKRQEILDKIAAKEALIIVGTHSLFSEDVVFNTLKLVVIDEQHKFGVHQRLLLSSKGQAVDMLVLSATPIPRTLCLTAYGDMDVTRLSEKPKNRKPITTAAVPTSRMNEVIIALKRALSSNQKVYWICPLIEASEKTDLAAAEARYADLRKMFGDAVGLLHGRMKADAKEAVMKSFSEGTTHILVSTTVVEVGVDVKDATIMVIEHAERFGLAQLHQLRGRIGRSDLASTCLLLYKPPLFSTAQKRIDVLRQTNDGFLIAEEDLLLRGEGDLIGLKQSGFPEMRIADLLAQKDLLLTARKESILILSKDPLLTSVRGKALKTLLFLLGKENALRNIKAG